MANRREQAKRRIMAAMLLSAGYWAFAAGAFAQTSAPAATPPVVKVPEFEVISVKQNKTADNSFMSRYSPSGVSMTNAPLIMLIRQAFQLYHSTDDQITGLPHEGVALRQLSPPLRRESTIAWRADNPSKPLKDYIQIVKNLSRSI